MLWAIKAQPHSGISLNNATLKFFLITIKPNRACVTELSQAAINSTPTWPVCPLCMCGPTGVCVSAGATRPAARGSASPPWFHRPHTPAPSPGSSSTSHRNTCCYLKRDTMRTGMTRLLWFSTKKQTNFKIYVSSGISNETDILRKVVKNIPTSWAAVKLLCFFSSL